MKQLTLLNMKRILLFIALSTTIGLGAVAQNNVTLNINHKLGNNVFAFDEGAINSMGHDFKVTRLQYYISEITLVHDGGNETAVEDFWILADAGESANYDLGSYDVNQIEAIKLHVGVDPEHNHEDPASYASDHPLAPQFPSMHWGWSAGYRFVAYEGYGGPNYNQLFELHGLEDPNYFETTIDVSATAESGEVLIDLDADYAQGLRDISVNSGVIVHGGYGSAKKCLENFRDYVFSEAGTVVGLSESEVTEFVIYPNPITNGTSEFGLITGVSDQYDVKVFDLMGKLVASFNKQIGNQTLDLNVDRAGIYFVNMITTNGSIYTQKLTVQ